MLDALTDKFNNVFRTLSGRGRISEENIREAMREVRTALLEADVSFKIVKDFTEAVVQKAIGREVIKLLRPGELMVQIVYEELVNLMGPVDTRIYYVQPPPTVIMMAGLQGAGKTTTCGKLAKYLVAKGHHPLLCAADLQRPAAVEQLRTLGAQLGIPVYTDDSKVAPHGEVAKGAAVSVCRAAIAQAKQTGRDVVILDTAGRLHIDDALMGELREVNTQLKPHQVFLVLDAMSGQDAVNSAKAFNEQLEVDGLILTKFDSDTRGGALLSAKMITGKPVKFIGTGEKLDALEEFRPEGMAQRILGMGDILQLVTEAQQKFSQEEAQKLQEKMEQGNFTLDDFMAQMGQVQKLGSMDRIMKMIPGMSQLTKQMNMGDGDVERQMGRMKAIYNSMNKRERKNPDLLDGTRRRRIARGAGVELNEVGQFMKQFEQTRDMMKAVGGMGMAGKMNLMKGLMSGKLNTLGMPGGAQLKAKKSGFMEKKDRNKKKKR
ncbi:signal recognition particle protein [Humisphaera borealis]|uniref:Signal recognition particle protein n=1 Tax=Humisphaera borealis TaxID=2807512 RepID=A0A7M2X232_9BACT|nr:signal recognition particle protein [Humisphaera borealis]QOV91724.1 signal recognition particle protein [Humisphaera borealis]